MTKIEITHYEKKQIKKFINKFRKRYGETLKNDFLKSVAFGIDKPLSKILAIITWLLLISTFVSAYVSKKPVITYLIEFSAFIPFTINLFLIKNYHEKNNLPMIQKHNPNRLIKQMFLCFQNNMVQPSGFSNTISALTNYQKYLNLNSGWVIKNLFKNIPTILSAISILSSLSLIPIIQKFKLTPLMFLIVLLIILLLTFVAICILAFHQPTFTTKGKINEINYIKDDLIFLKNNLFYIQSNQYKINDKFISETQSNIYGFNLFKNRLIKKCNRVKEAYDKSYPNHDTHKSNENK
ncbi:hypothetical protein [Fructobacillus fructosus]|uniref:hypothetical protein n=1 Tax=Fructobacillus fructosus TaxID=1631 RepID=UPI002DAC40F7|nr:unnamed protein product [Fructobacillus fructosus]CAK1251683.1 unnamed protein product [Fructobacillus fructosus]